MSDITANFLCIDYLKGTCEQFPCRNHHVKNLEAAKSEYEIKRMNRICYNFNFNSKGCMHNPCKFLHVYIPVHPYNVKYSKVDSALSTLRVNLLKLESIYDELQAYKREIGLNPPAGELIDATYTGIYETINRTGQELIKALDKIDPDLRMLK